MAGSPYTNKLLTVSKHLTKYLFYLFGNFTKYKVCSLPIDFESIDIIHSNTNRQDIGAYISSRYGIKHIWHIREMGQEDYNVIFYKKNCIQYMNKAADSFIMISNAVKNRWSDKGLDVCKMHTIYDGMDTADIKKRKKTVKDKIRIVITGHVQPNKGQLHLVQAISKLPANARTHVELDIIGEAYPDYKKRIEAEIRKNNLEDRINLLGYRDNINKLLSEYDIGVTCSKAEGLGRCTAEYMLAGLFTIASNTGANPEIIQNNRTGMLYKYGDIHSLSFAVLWGLQHPQERELIAEAGYNAAQYIFSKEQYADDLYSIYLNCLNN